MRTTTNTIVTLALLIAATFGAASNAAAQQQVNIKTLFWMLAADAFPDYVPQTTVREEFHISAYDDRNGYLGLAGIHWEMCYLNQKDDGNWWRSTVPETSDLRFYY